MRSEEDTRKSPRLLGMKPSDLFLIGSRVTEVKKDSISSGMNQVMYFGNVLLSLKQKKNSSRM